MNMNELIGFVNLQIKNSEYLLAFYRQKIMTLEEGTSEKNQYKIQLIDKEIELEKWKYCLRILKQKEEGT